MTDKEDKALKLALEAAEVLEKLFKQAEAMHEVMEPGINVHCQITMADLSKGLYAAHAILLKHEQAVIEVMCELQKAKEDATKAERQRIVNLLMIQHEMANGAHNYWHVAAQLIQADVASDT